ncbi:MAG: BamA/TamA family outer membrane protein [Bacteroidaceae bacterium]|nr:BamA/TamA family outer membrane protein [Bacteroidaceae bacterium]
MRKRRIQISSVKCIMLCLCIVFAMSSCVSTKNLPEGELLYTGQKSMVVKNFYPHTLGRTALEEVEAAVATAPNNAFMGSSTITLPFSFHLWAYNRYLKSESGVGKWMFDHFAKEPVLLSSVNPDIRIRAAKNVLRDYGFFNGNVSYETFIDKDDSLKAKLQYTLDMGNPSFIDTVEYRGFSTPSLRIIERGRQNTLLPSGTQFNVTALNDERTRISNILRDAGRYYFRPDYMIYQADTTLVPGRVSMRLVPIEGIPEAADRPFYVGEKTINVMGKYGEAPNDSIIYEDLRINFHNKLPIREKVLKRWVTYSDYRMKRRLQDSASIIGRLFRSENLYSLHRQNRIQERLTNTGIFRYIDMQYTPRDSALVSDTLDASINLMLDKPYMLEADFNAKFKSNNQMGPGASVTLSKNNIFGGAETWNVTLDGYYEWQTGKYRSSDMNSYQIGLSSSLVFPRILFFRLGKREYDFPATTTFRVYANVLNRPKYYNMRSFGGNVTYDFQPTSRYKHSFTPFKLAFNTLSRMTPEFEQLIIENPALYISLQDQFIPSMSYTMTYDNSGRSGVKHPLWWQNSLSSAGNVTSLVYKIGGKDFTERGKKMLGVPFAQFLKLTTELRYHYILDKNQMIAARVLGGFIWSYGNATTAPYMEQFYIGGANSVRSYTTRSVGPGGYPPDENNKYSFISHVGDMRLEANVEYRFRLVGDLDGAVFLDAGNVWLLRKDENRPDARFSLKKFPKQIALGTGLGLRYDMDYLVFRLDLGVGLHHPYDTGKKGYFNIPKLKDGMALHFAIGYPF